MKALITAGGRATRLRPITWTINKHCIPLAGKPMLEWAITKIAQAGVAEIGINVNPGDTEIPKLFGDGSRFGAKITYLEQQGGPLGVGHIVKNAKAFLGNEPFIFYLGDNIILGDLGRFVRRFEEEQLDALLALSRVREPNRFGVPEIVDGKIVRVLEKPEVPPSPFAVTGIYIYSPKVHDAVERVKPSVRGELEISDVHTELITSGARVGHEEITGWWKDTGKPEDLLEGNALLLDELRAAPPLQVETTIDPSARIQGWVQIGKGTVIGANTILRGPIIIGENCIIRDSFVGPYTQIGNGVILSGTELEHSLVFDGAHIRANERLADCLIGKQAVICSKTETLPKAHRLIVGDNALVEL